MPNWCYNRLEVTGDKQEVERFKREVAGDSLLDFERILPSAEDKARVLKEYEQPTPLKKDMDFDTYWFNHGGYEWCSQNWGTKWNAHDVHTGDIPDGVAFSFDTAWSPPMGILDKLIETYPKLRFRLVYEETGMMFGGEVIAEGGKVIEQNHYQLEMHDCDKCGDGYVLPEGEPAKCPNCDP